MLALRGGVGGGIARATRLLSRTVVAVGLILEAGTGATVGAVGTGWVSLEPMAVAMPPPAKPKMITATTISYLSFLISTPQFVSPTTGAGGRRVHAPRGPTQVHPNATILTLAADIDSALRWLFLPQACAGEWAVAITLKLRSARPRAGKPENLAAHNGTYALPGACGGPGGRTQAAC